MLNFDHLVALRQLAVDRRTRNSRSIKFSLEVERGLQIALKNSCSLPSPPFASSLRKYERQKKNTPRYVVLFEFFRMVLAQRKRIYIAQVKQYFLVKED